MIHSIDQLDLSKTYSYADYLTWQFEEMVELIRGKVFRISPAPNRKHQEISMNTTRALLPILNKTPTCKIYTAPFDVRLCDRRKSAQSDSEVFTVVQPDICIVCDRSKLDEQGCNGAPELVVEILSKGNSKREVNLKYELYEESGVREYWVVYPYEYVLQQFVLNEHGKYDLKGIFAEDMAFKVSIFPALEVSLKDVFHDLD